MMPPLGIKAVVLAAGKSTRFKTKKSKHLYSICGRPMVLYPVVALNDLGIPVTVVLGYQGDAVQKLIEDEKLKDVTFVNQPEQLGTAHAVACTSATWGDAEDILVINGDMPMITSELINDVILDHRKNKSTLTFVSAMVLDPFGYGRVLEQNGKYTIVEEKHCTDDELLISKVNVGIYVINRNWLINNLPSISKSPQGEYYLTDLINLASKQDVVVKDVAVPFDFVRGVNTLQELWNAEQIKRSEFIKHWMAEGVRFEMAQSIHVDINVKIGAGSFIGTGVHLLGNTTIGQECFVGAFSIIENTSIGDSTIIHSHSVIQNSKIGSDVHVGPFARLRSNVTLENSVQVGNFVEIKNSEMGSDSRAKHLTYVGDAVVGKSVNIGAGTVTCNYDGVNKFKTVVEDGAFVGSNNTLIAPVTIGKGSYTAGGSTITQDVPEGCLGIGRARQENKPDYVQKKLDKKKVDKCQKSPNLLGNEEALSESEIICFNFNGAMKTKSQGTL